MNRHELAPGMAWDSDGRQLLTIPTPGRKFFIDSDAGDDDNDGDYGEPLKTIVKAHSLAVSGRGDHFILCNYPFDAIDFLENLVITKAALSMYPLYYPGNSRYPTVAPATGIALSISGVGGYAFDCRYVRFYSADDVAFKYASEGSRFYRADFSSVTGIGVSLRPTTTGTHTGHGLHMEECMIRDCGGAGIKNMEADDGPRFASFVNLWRNQFYGNTGADILDGGAGATNEYYRGWDIMRNKFMTKDKALYLDMDGGKGVDSMLHQNFFAGAVNTNTVKIVAGIVSIGNRGTGGLVDAIPAP